MSLIQRRSGTHVGGSGGKYVADLTIRRMWASSDFGKTFKKTTLSTTYNVGAADICDATGIWYLAISGNYGTIYKSTDNLETASLFYTRDVFSSPITARITRTGDKLFLLSSDYLEIFNAQTGAVIKRTAMESDVGYYPKKMDISADGKYIVVAYDDVIRGSNTYDANWNMSAEIKYKLTTYNKFYDMKITGDGKWVYYTYESGDADHTGFFRLSTADGLLTKQRITVTGLSNAYAPQSFVISHTGRYIVVSHSNVGTLISKDYGKSFSSIGPSGSSQVLMSDSGKCILMKQSWSVYSSTDYGDTFTQTSFDGLYSLYASRY